MKDIILENFSRVSWGRKISLHIGDALEILQQWNDEEFDLAFIDADKRRYSDYFKMVFPLIKPGGYIIADNTLWDGHVTESCEHSSQTRGIMDFNGMVAERPDAEVAMIPVRDGMTIIRKLPKQTLT